MVLLGHCPQASLSSYWEGNRLILQGVPLEVCGPVLGVVLEQSHLTTPDL